MPQVVIVSSLGPQGPVGPQGLQGLTGSMAESNSGSFAITGSLTVSGSSTFTNIGPAIFSGSSNFTSLTASSALISGDVTVLGTASINTLIVNQTQLSTGSNQLGDAANDTQTLYGTVRIPTGSLTVSGSSYFTGNVGIGTANPSFILDVVGNTRTNLTSFASQFKGDGGYANANAFSFSGNGNIGMYFPSNVNLGFSTSGNERMRIDASGSIGIGTTTPSYTLDVSGSLRVGTPTATPHLIFARASNNYITTPVGGTLLFNLNNSAAENASIVGIYSTGLKIGTGFSSPSAVAHVRGSGTTSATTALLVQNSNASASLTVLDNGYVGIGSTAPLRQLYVVGDIEVTNGIYGDSTDHTFYTIASGSFDHRFYSRTSGGASLERFTIQGGADTANTYFQNTNVGIGTTAPSAKLEIKATGSNETTQRWLDNAGNLLGDFAEQGDAGVLRLGYVINSVVPNRPLITLDGGLSNTSATISLRSKSSVTNIRIASDLASYISGSNLALGFTSPTASAILHISGAAADNVFRVDTPTTPYALFITGSGNVGIGTTTTAANLEIKGSATALQLTTSDYVLGASGSRTIIGFGASTGNTYSRIQTTDAGGVSASDLVLQADSGNVGIGITAPVSKLQVTGNGATYGEAITWTGAVDYGGANRGFVGYDAAAATTAYIGNQFTGGDGVSARFQIRMGTSPKLTVMSGGNIGIGTTIPSASLHISGSSGSVLFEIDSNSTQNILYVSGSGNVSIGTNSPQRRLHVDASGSVNPEAPLLLTSVNTVSNRVGILFASSSVSAGKQHYLYHRVNGPVVEWLLGMGAGETGIWRFLPQDNTSYGVNILAPFSGGTTYITTGISQSLFSLGAGGQTNQHINISSSGNVGIGTSTPGYKLEVNGGPINIVNGFSDPTAEAGYRLKFADNGGITNDSGIGLSGGLGNESLWINKGAPNGNIRFMFGTSGEKVTFTSTGSVGIGTTTPSASLHISGSSGSVLLEVDSNSQQNILYVSGSGNIGIGTSTPSEKLHVSGNIKIEQAGNFNTLLTLNSNSSVIGTNYQWNLVGTNSGESYAFQIRQATTPYIHITNTAGGTGGNVGIGTTVPTARTHVKGSGTTSATTTLRVENSSASPSLTITDDLTSRFFGNVGIGALPASGSLHISGAASTSSAAVYIYKSGSTTLDIQGSQGQLFSVTDALSGSLMSVNDISGLPILEVFSDDRVVMGSFSQPALLVTGSAVRFPATASTAPAYTGSEGQVVFGVVGGNAFIYAWLGGRWRSGSLA